MTTTPSWVPDDVDMERPSAARIYDYLLGGGHNFAIDREMADRLLAAEPGVRDLARVNRAFLRRAVLHLLDQGVRQFLDLGSGIPTVGNVHEIATAADPDSRVVYVDHEEVAVAHSKLILDGVPNAAVLHADATRPADVLAAPETRRVIDFDQPVAILAVTLFHYVSPDRDPAGVVAAYRDAVPSGSHLALTHFTRDFAEVGTIVDMMKSSRDNVFPRSFDEVTALFDGFELAEPGLVQVQRWRPQSAMDTSTQPGAASLYAGIGRKP